MISNRNCYMRFIIYRGKKIHHGDIISGSIEGEKVTGKLSINEWMGDYLVSDQPLKFSTQPELIREVK